jgi:hypothetical protein
MCAAIALKLCTWLYIYILQISSKMVAIDQFLEELCPLNKKSIFRTFFLFAYRYSFDIWYIALPYQGTDQV